MSDKPKIIAGLVIFLALATFPFWYAQVAPALGAVPFLHSQAAPEPVLTPPTDGSHCIEDAAWMKAHHMELLDKWRDEVVRDGVSDPYTSTGYPEDKPCARSLTKTCLKCHSMLPSNAEGYPEGKRSCKDCHEYANVRPACWDCHVEPIGKGN